MIKHYKVKLHVLTPIHIGMGDAYDPTQFVFDEDGNMFVFDTNEYLNALSLEKSEEFCKMASDSRNPVKVFRFFKENFKTVRDTISCRQIKVSKDLCDRYNDICKTGSLSKEQINQFELRRTIYNPIKGVPYIPGSSLKGCLKTIWMSVFNQTHTKIRNAGNINKLELDILKGSFNKDPFRMVKVSDLYPVENKDSFQTEIKYAVMFPRKTDKEQRGDLTVSLEVIRKGQIFEGVIDLDDGKFIPSSERPESRVTLLSLSNKEGKVSVNGLGSCAKNYYWQREVDGKAQKQKLQNEFSYLKSIEASNMAFDMSFKDKLWKTCFPVRLGMHSSAEFITIDDNRNIKISPPQVKKPVFGKQATTIWLASSKRKPESPKGLAPFGWAMLEFEEIK